MGHALNGMGHSLYRLGEANRLPAGALFSQKQYSIFTKLYVHLRGVLECVFKCPGKKLSNMASPANLTMLSRTASKFCAHICAAPPEIFFLDLKSYENSGIIGPWPECQLTPTTTTTTARRDSRVLGIRVLGIRVLGKISRSGHPLTLINIIGNLQKKQ